MMPERPPKRLVGWRYAALVGGLVGLIGVAIYPIIISPYLYPEKWQERQRIARAQMDAEKHRTGNMKAWTDPFDRKK